MLPLCQSATRFVRFVLYLCFVSCTLIDSSQSAIVSSRLSQCRTTNDLALLYVSSSRSSHRWPIVLATTPAKLELTPGAIKSCALVWETVDLIWSLRLQKHMLSISGALFVHKRTHQIELRRSADKTEQSARFTLESIWVDYVP